MSRYSSYRSEVTSPSYAIGDSRKSSSLLRDDSWIKRSEDEYEAVDKDPNFGKSVLSRYKSNENIGSSDTEEVKTSTGVPTRSTSVQALTKRFSGGVDQLSSSTIPSSRTRSYSSKTSYSSVTPDSPTTTTTTTVIKDGETTETTITTTESISSPISKTPTKTETFTERVQSTSKGPQYTSYSPTRKAMTETVVTSKKDAEDKLFDSLTPSSITDSRRTITSETVTVKTSNDSEDKLYDTLIPNSVKDVDSTTTTTETVTVKRSSTGDDIKTTTTTRTLSTAEDELYGTLLPTAITSPVSSSITMREIVTVESSRGEESPTSLSSSHRLSSYGSYDDVPSTRTTSYTVSSLPASDHKSYSYSRPNSSYEYSSISSPTEYTTTTYRSRSDDILSDPIYNKTSKSVYSSSERTVLEKDLCTSCRKPFIGDAKMILDDMKINCHASCFKCEVCNSTLGHLKAGDSMWIYKRMVHCDRCFEITREKWRH